MATDKMNPLDKKLKNDDQVFGRITNEDLVCKDCAKKYDDTLMPCNTSKCEAFNVKPNDVLDGGDCDEYEDAE